MPEEQGESAIGVCESCGMPVRVVFYPDGTTEVYAVCKCPRGDSSTHPISNDLRG